jgi:predicted amidohydrolase YtcJ
VVTEHGGIVNRRATALCKFTRDEAPQGFIRGRVVIAALHRAVHTLPHQLLLDGAARFVGDLARLGVTSVQLIGDEFPDLFEELRAQGRLGVRVRLVPLANLSDRFYRIVRQTAK